jgi:transposase
MFLRRCIRKKNGKRHTYWVLVESVRTARGSRQRVVAYLGELTSSQKSGWVQLGRRLEGKDRPSPTLFDPPGSAEVSDEVEGVRLKGIRLERTRDFGDVWLGWGLWRLLGLDTLLSQRMPAGQEEVSWPVVATILTIARLCEPSSEPHIEQTWYRRTALDDLLGVAAERVHHRRLYEGLDHLLPHKASIEKHLKHRLGDLFDLEYDLLLYDVTSTYFEGECAANPMARRGYSRDSRPDCLQVCIGLPACACLHADRSHADRVVTTDGMPLGYEVFDGNRSDVTTVEQIVEAMEAKYGRAGRIWVLDRGRVDEENLSYLRERAGHCIVGTPRNWLRRYERELTDLPVRLPVRVCTQTGRTQTGTGWSSVYQDLEVKLCPSPEGKETFVLCCSTDRAKKEQGMHERFSKRIEEALSKLQRRLSKTKKRPNRSQIERQIGRLLQRNSRAAGKYDIHVKDDPDRKGHLKLQWTCREEWSEWANLSEGAYLLRTNLTGKSPEELWQMYIQRADAEAAFRTLQSEWVLRPVYPQIEQRVQAHILVAFWAYTMWKTLQKWMDNSSLGRGVRTVLEEFGRLKCCEVILPTDTGRQIQLRCVTQPDECQRGLLQRLGVEVPKRLGQPKWRKLIET